MNSPLERRYRRILRLLPAGYRQRWEEDMVVAFMESAHAGDPDASEVAASRPKLSERLSVIALAARVRLNGSHATPRGLVWYQVVSGIALMSLLYQALAATVSVAFGVGLIMVLPRPLTLSFFLWSPVFSLFWVAAFFCYVLGRRTATRVLAVLALLSAIGVTETTHILVSRAGGGEAPFAASDISRWGWLAVSVVTAFTYPVHAQLSRRFWSGMYLVGSLALVPPVILMLTRLNSPYGPVVQFANLTTVTWGTLIVAMAVALGRAARGRHASPHWLLSLAAFAAGVGGVRLMTSFAMDAWPMVRPVSATVFTTLDATVVLLALLCAVVGLVTHRRQSGEPLSLDGQ